jgi:hypothetical protein
MGEPFFSWRVEQAAIGNAALPGTVNPKPASPLSTYSLALDFLPRHLEPGPAFRPPSPPPPPPQPNHSIWKKTSCHWISHFSFSLVWELVIKASERVSPGLMFGRAEIEIPRWYPNIFSYPHNSGFYIPLKWCPVGPHCHLLFAPHCPLKHVIYKVFKLRNPRMRSLNSPHQLFWFSPTSYHL